MKIAIISDTHDDFEKVRKLIPILEEKRCEALIHCGDFCAPFMLKEIAAFKGEVHACFGNTNDRFMSVKIADENKVNLHGDTGSIILDGKRIAINHYPSIARALAMTGDFDAVFYGHNHIKDSERLKDCWLVNPGEIKGYKNHPSYAIYDTKTDEIEFFDY